MRQQNLVQTKDFDHKDQITMNYKAQIEVHENVDRLYDCFLPEIVSTGRAKVNLKKTKDCLTLTVEAKDPVALRAMLTGLTKLFEVYEKVPEK